MPNVTSDAKRHMKHLTRSAARASLRSPVPHCLRYRSARPGRTVARTNQSVFAHGRDGAVDCGGFWSDAVLTIIFGERVELNVSWNDERQIGATFSFIFFSFSLSLSLSLSRAFLSSISQADGARRLSPSTGTTGTVTCLHAV